jgi:hypothetical protein
MDDTRQAARKLARQGVIVITQKGQVRPTRVCLAKPLPQKPLELNWYDWVSFQLQQCQL